MTRAESEQPPRGVALGGFMGAGKSTVGRALAARLGLGFVDMDDVLTNQYGPIPEQFAEHGEKVFRERERELVIDLCDDIPRVVATGGGAWADPVNRDLLREHYALVVLNVSMAVAGERIGQDGGRPMWIPRYVYQLYLARRAAYADAELVVEANKSVDDIVEEIATWLR